MAWDWLRYSDVLPKLTEGETRSDIHVVLRNLSLSLSFPFTELALFASVSVSLSSLMTTPAY